MEEIESQFGIKNYSITTDSGANIKSAMKNKNWVPCFDHRLHTVVQKSWGEFLENNIECKLTYNRMTAIRSFLKRSNDTESKLPVKMPNENPTRSWCGYSDFFTSFVKSYEKIGEIIPDHLDMPADKNFVDKISACLQDFADIFKKLEAAKTPTIHLVLKSCKDMFLFMDKWPRQAEEFRKPLKKCIFI